MIQAFNHTLINAPLKQVASWFKTVLPYNYLAIHPSDHLELTPLDKKPIKVGSIFKLREYIGQRFYLSTNVEITEITETSFAFKALFPYSLINVRARFSLKKINNQETEVIAENYAGYDVPLLGPLLDFFITLFLPYSVLKQHMKEENNFIKQLIEVSKLRPPL